MIEKINFAVILYYYERESKHIPLVFFKERVISEGKGEKQALCVRLANTSHYYAGENACSFVRLRFKLYTTLFCAANAL